MPNVSSPQSVTSSDPSQSSLSPDYPQLVRFLIQPFLEQTETLSVDCETNVRTGRVLIRVAFEAEDKGRIFGRGGRNIQAVRTVIQAAAKVVGQTAYLDVYNGGGDSADSESSPPRRSSSPRRSHRPPPRSRSAE
jgi:uncharacterized protein